MANFGKATVRIYDSRVDDLFTPNGVVGRGTGRLGQEAKAIATKIAPRNKYGKSDGPGLANLHRYRTGVGRRGRYFTSTLINEASYAVFVHEGTVGPITPRNPLKKMPIAGTANNVFAFAEVVRGQSANPWMEKAGITAMRRLGYSR